MSETIDSTAEEIEPTPFRKAQERLVAALQRTTNPQVAGLAAYVNGALMSARLNAILEFITTETNGTWTPKERIDSLLVKHLNATADQIEQASRSAPRVVVPDNADAAVKRVINGH